MKISVIVAAYNAEKTLEESIASVLSQTHQDIEVIIVDDKSKDGTLALARDIASRDNRVRVIEAAQNGGPAKARNAALDVASGDWVGIVDSDDLILPDRFEKMLSAALSTGSDIVFDNLFYVTPHNGAEHLYIPSDTKVFGELSLETFIASHRKSVNIPNLGFLKPIIRRSSIETVGLRYDTALKIGEDAMLIMDLLAMGAKAVLLPDAYYRYHRHDGSISAVQGMDNVLAITTGYGDFLKKYDGRLEAGAVSVMRGLIADNHNRLAVGQIVQDILDIKMIAAISALVQKPNYAVATAKALAGYAKRKLRARS